MLIRTHTRTRTRAHAHTLYKKRRTTGLAEYSFYTVETQNAEFLIHFAQEFGHINTHIYKHIYIYI